MQPKYVKKKASTLQERDAVQILYGPHPIIECLKAARRKITAVYTTQPYPKAWQRISTLLPRYVKIHHVGKDVLARMADTSEHGGVVATVMPFKFSSTPFNPAKKRFILLLDAIQDVRNLGAILRSAYCIGVQGVVLCKKQGASLSPTVFKASAGLAEHLDIYQAPSMAAAAQELKRAGYNLYMAVVEGGTNATMVTYTEPLCLVIGNEAVGISKEVQKEGRAITLPQVRPDISYNASVAAGILLFLMAPRTKAS